MYEDDMKKRDNSAYDSNAYNGKGSPVGPTDYQPIYLLAPDIRKGFITKVYTILTCQLFVTTVIAGVFVYFAQDKVGEDGPKGRRQSIGEFGIPYVISFVIGGVGYLVCAIIMCCCPNMVRKYPRNYIFLTFMTIFMSLLLGVSTARFKIPAILLSAGITVGLFIGLTLFAKYSKSDFTGCGPYLFVALLVLILASLIIGLFVAFMGPETVRWISIIIGVIVVLLFSFFIVYDTQLILGGPGKKYQYSVDDYAFAAIALYLDVVNLFMALLGLAGSD